MLIWTKQRTKVCFSRVPPFSCHVLFRLKLSHFLLPLAEEKRPTKSERHLSRDAEFFFSFFFKMCSWCSLRKCNSRNVHMGGSKWILHIKNLSSDDVTEWHVIKSVTSFSFCSLSFCCKAFSKPAYFHGFHF